jgi:hypothetical protein
VAGSWSSAQPTHPQQDAVRENWLVDLNFAEDFSGQAAAV